MHKIMKILPMVGNAFHIGVIDKGYIILMTQTNDGGVFYCFFGRLFFPNSFGADHETNFYILLLEFEDKFFHICQLNTVNLRTLLYFFFLFLACFHYSLQWFKTFVVLPHQIVHHIMDNGRVVFVHIGQKA